MNPRIINNQIIKQLTGHKEELAKLKKEFRVKSDRVGLHQSHRIQISANRAAAASGIKRTSFQNILKKDLKFKPYKIQENQKLLPADPGTRFAFAKQFIKAVNSRTIRVEDVMITDECNIPIDGYRNKQNIRYWDEEKPPYFNEKEHYSPKLSIWAGLCGDFLVGPYFFQDEKGNNVNINAANYTEMIQKYLMPELEARGAQNRIWFQQDGAPAHTSRQSMQTLKNLFPGRLISQKGGDINWPPRSPDLSSCDFYLWSRIKEYVFERNPQDLQSLKICIIEAFGKITTQELRDVSREVWSRIQRVAEVNGEIFEHL